MAIRENVQLGNLDVLFFVRPDLLDKYKVTLNSFHDILECCNLDSQTPLIQKTGQRYLKWDDSQKTRFTLKANKENYTEFFYILLQISF